MYQFISLLPKLSCWSLSFDSSGLFVRPMEAILLIFVFWQQQCLCETNGGYQLKLHSTDGQEVNPLWSCWFCINKIHYLRRCVGLNGLIVKTFVEFTLSNLLLEDMWWVTQISSIPCRNSFCLFISGKVSWKYGLIIHVFLSFTCSLPVDSSKGTAVSGQAVVKIIADLYVFFWKTVEERMANTFTPPLHEDLGIHYTELLSVWWRNPGPLQEADQASWVISPTLLTLHPWHQMTRLSVKQRSPQESQPSQHRFHLVSGAAAQGWWHHKDGRHTHNQSSLLQWAPRKKAWSWCSKKVLPRPAEETACIDGNHPWVMATEGLIPRQLVLISEKSQS